MNLDELEMVWEEPPPSGKYGELLEWFVGNLKLKPNSWSKLPPHPETGEQYPLSVLTSLRKSYGAHIEYTSRKTGTANRNYIWARWLEPADPDAEARARRSAVRGL